MDVAPRRGRYPVDSRPPPSIGEFGRPRQATIFADLSAVISCSE